LNGLVCGVYKHISSHDERKKYTRKIYAYCPRQLGIGGMKKNLAYMLQEMKYLLRGTRVSKVVEEKII
jgi:hypothetical protein